MVARPSIFAGPEAPSQRGVPANYYSISAPIHTPDWASIDRPEERGVPANYYSTISAPIHKPDWNPVVLVVCERGGRCESTANSKYAKANGQCQWRRFGLTFVVTVLATGFQCEQAENLGVQPHVPWLTSRVRRETMCKRRRTVPRAHAAFT